ncbi:MAG: hypothetical protein KAJ51_10020 [Thermoplasmata archaeon]|nr:hypothetical protein [Thermoplasmata archaeon]
MDYQNFIKLGGCPSCKYFPGPYFLEPELESPWQCYYCYDHEAQEYRRYEPKKKK